MQIIEEAFYIDSDNSLDKSEELGTDKVGYRSIHYIARIKEDRLILTEYKKFESLRFEIQVRTILQHAWAEIEHDKNYKFNGVLPPEIKRRFKILAGTLELADREFNQLSQEIDKISNNVSIAEADNKLETITLNSTTLRRYLSDKFNDWIDQGIIEPNFNGKDDLILKELNDFDIRNLEDLNKLVPSDYIEKARPFYTEFPSTPNNFLGLLRDLMIIANSNKYFEFVWKKGWSYIEEKTKNLYENHNIDVDELSLKYKFRCD
ncbi:GTP pyrophosphokinase family protein [Mucilaginibacter terrae]|uniref:GTP pyrophosphokinase n=1 Tax=Mucilaginibacter terrae TaxID=1955052 RepID=UPI003643F610